MTTGSNGGTTTKRKTDGEEARGGERAGILADGRDRKSVHQRVRRREGRHATRATTDDKTRDEGLKTIAGGAVS